MRVVTPVTTEAGPMLDLALVAKYMLPSATRGCRKNKSEKRQEVCPRFEIPMCNHVIQNRDQAPGPSILGALGYRSANPPVAYKNLPHTGSPLRQGTRHVRDTVRPRSERAETGGTAATEAEAQDSLADLTSAEALSTKPIHQDERQIPAYVSGGDPDP